MPALQLKDCPQDIYDSLKRCATAEDRSMSQQTLHILRNFLHRYENMGADVADSDQTVFRYSAPQNSAPDFNNAALGASALEKRLGIFQEIRNLEPLVFPKKYSDTAALVREEREARIASVDPKLKTHKARN